MANTAEWDHTRMHTGALVERYFPMAIAIGSAVAWLLFGDKAVTFCAKRQWHLDQLYAAVFAFLAVTTGFLATYYCTLVAMSEGFVRYIRDTRIFSGLLAYVKASIILGFFVSIASVPMMIIQPLPSERFSFWAFVVAAWLGLAAWALAAFGRVAMLFFITLETRGEPRKPAG